MDVSPWEANFCYEYAHANISVTSTVLRLGIAVVQRQLTGP